MSIIANYTEENKDFEIHLIMYGKQPRVFYQMNKNIVIHKPKQNFNDSLRFFSTLKRISYLRKTVINIHPDAVLNFGTLWNRFVVFSLLGTGYPVFISNRGNPLKKLSFFQELLGRILYPKAAGIIAQTPIAQSLYQKQNLNNNIKVIGNPIRKIRLDTQIEKENIIISVGRLINTKHHDRLIRIFSKLNAPRWKLIIIGGNALKQNNLTLLSELVNELGLKNRVVLTGELSDIDEYYQKSKIFAFTSSSEGFPNVVGEALSVGLPVVSYDCVASPSEMISDGENGFLVPVFDDDLFQKRLQLLIDDEELRNRMSANAPASVEKYSIEKIGQQYLDFILS